MESGNRHLQHQLQEQLVVSSPLFPAGAATATATPSSCFASAPSNHPWTPNIILNSSTTGSFNPNFNGILFNPPRQKNESSVAQDLGFHCLGNAGSSFPQDQLHPKIKELPSQSFPKFTEMINNSSSSSVEDLHSPPTSCYLSEKLLLKSFSSAAAAACHINGLQLSGGAGDFYGNAQICSAAGYGGVAIPSRGHFSQIFPSVNISSLSSSTQSSSPVVSGGSPLDMNLQALDLLTSARFSGDFSHPSHSLGLFRDSLAFGLDHQSFSRSPNTSTKISPFTNGVAEVKRPCSFLETKATPKKSRLEPRASCPPIKVRKEKLGDRIAALQQLVAPFGKTDTASVLMEAIGYIKFLQNQVETLSVPYMKSSRNKSSISSMQGGSGAEGEGSEEGRRDLRSRGLCLVPLSCMSYVTTDCGGGGGVWPATSFGAGT